MLRRRNAGCLYLLQEVENQAGCIGTAAGRVRGLSQTLAWATRWAVPTQISRFVSRRQTETDRQQPVLFAHRPGTREAEPLPQPQHGFETPDRSSRRAEGLKATDPRHRPFDPEMIALDPLLQVLGDVMERISRQQPVFPGGCDGRRVGSGPRPCQSGRVRVRAGLSASCGRSAWPLPDRAWPSGESRPACRACRWPGTGIATGRGS